MNVTRSKTVLLSISLLLIELIAGIQIYVLSLITPEIGADLGAQNYFGLITTASLAASFITIPLAPIALMRWKSSSILFMGTLITILGNISSAVAQDILVFAAGRILSGLAAGLLGAVSLAAIVKHLEKRWRQMVLAGYSAMWVLSSIIGPLYAGLISETMSWRWALVLYLPFLLASRTLVAISLPEEPQGDSFDLLAAGKTIKISLILCISVFIISISSGSNYTWMFLTIGIIGVFFSARKLLPTGVFTLRKGRTSAVLLKFLLTGIYLGADSVIAIAITHRFENPVPIISATLMASGLAWALTGMWTGAKPATGNKFIRRGIIGVSSLCIGFIGIGYILISVPPSAIFSLICYSGLTGIGIGFIYLDIMNMLFDESSDDGLTNSEMATASVLSESIASTTFIATLGALISKLVISEASYEYGILFLILSAAALTLLVPLKRAVATEK